MARRRGIEAPPANSAGVIRKLLITLVILASVVLVVLAGASTFLTYRIVTAHDNVENITPANYLMSSFEPVNFTDHSGGEHEGWLLLGLNKAPVILLCHGYNSNRSDMLPLGTLLRDNHFNVYLFNFQAAKGGKRFSNLGIREADDLVAALETLIKIPKVNAQRVGIYGVNSGGYAGLVAAERSPLVKALVVDTVFENPDQLLEFQIDQLLGRSSSLFHFLAVTEFHLLSRVGKMPHLREDLPKLGAVPKFFISSRDVPVLARVTESLYSQASPPKRLLVLEHSQSGSASSEEEVEHNNQILGYFLQNLPLRAD